MDKNATIENIREYLKDYREEIKNFNYRSNREQPIITDEGLIEFVDIDGLQINEQEYGIIFKFLDRLFKIDCWYSSWDDGEFNFNTMYEVCAMQETVTVYGILPNR